MPRENGVFNCQYMACEEDRHSANMIGEVQARDGQLYLPLSQCEVWPEKYLYRSDEELAPEHLAPLSLVLATRGETSSVVLHQVLTQVV